MKEEPDSESKPKPKPKEVSRLEDGVEPGVWRYVHAERATVIVDAADYFAAIQSSMLKARRRIMMVGWDFDTRIHLTEGRRWWQRIRTSKYPSRLGSFIVWLTNHRDDLEIRILKWSFGVFKFVVRGAMWADLLRWFPHRRIDFKFDNAHPVGCSHHQKIVVLDNRLAVCGGIDMTMERWDTPDHDEHNEARKTPDGAEYGPWHDATMMMEGEVAGALDDLGRDRWVRAGGKPLDEIEPADRSLWPDGLDVMFEDVEIGIARTRAAYREWDEVREIEQLFLDHIARAKRFIYIESQYFASRVLTEAIVSRMEEEDPPEVFVVHPANADGWLEQQAMDHARAELVRCIEEADHKHRFSIWVPHSGETPIYVHAKIMIVDDEVLRIGSANFNNRSLGLDSECDLFIDTARPGNDRHGAAIAGLRHALLGEHAGLDPDAVAEALDTHGSMSGMVDHADSTNHRSLRRYHPPELDETEEKLAHSQLLDPESPEDMFEPFAKGGLYRKGGRLRRLRNRILRKGNG
ncbi:phospholipase D-like domain-containing protein [Paraurantiacibacter namhicola]|uniref:Phospholipase D n=1 Tax=Paraurantiacibacter namhicola TaxID=645517 RepID=A0A1C7D9L5_9SPHN|nr:phospholipase D-like domain-containing protein [Paraurantiacibacter namhicola]ANU08189.1 putative cardiolipin synthase YwiE [Paraurantiacibacter namhicola]